MGELTTLTMTAAGKELLRTTVPRSISKQFKLKLGDALDWTFEAKDDGEIVLIVKPVRRTVP